MNSSSEKWQTQLSKWAIPQEIIDQAEESPWIHPPAVFQISKKIELTISHEIALEAIGSDGSVLDIGCGGGVAAFALVPPARVVIGVDHQPEMLDMFSENAFERNVDCQIFLGFWPEVANVVPIADVVTAHHVLYNVANVEEFLKQMDVHAKKRVVIEIPTSHPLSNMNDLWMHFWGLTRPNGPTHLDLISVIRELGFEPNFRVWLGELRSTVDADQAAEYMRIRLCLPKSRLSEVRDFMANKGTSSTREIATIWWDKK
jgi:SAM-dependent methyltransferase